MQECILALDLGTTAFKAAPASDEKVFGRPTIVRYALDSVDGGVTCPPERYARALFRALRGAARTAYEMELTVRGIGICSQAQTFIAVDERGEPTQPAIVWTDDRATAEAEDAARALSDFARTGGFVRPSPLQFLPKVKQLKHQGNTAQKFLLLNEWAIFLLTGEAYGDETNQGMGGFFDIERRTWSPAALEWSGITSENLAQTAPAAACHALLKPEIVRRLGLPTVPVSSCGNDQSAAAVGAGLERAGDVLCNFGTAMVVYALRSQPIAPTSDAQIAGISPFAPYHSTEKNGWFLLGLESECGNVLDWLSQWRRARQSAAQMITEVLQADFAPETLPRILRIGGGKLDVSDLRVGSTPTHLVRALLEYYAARFAEILNGVREAEGTPCRLFASGGLSQNDAWLGFLSQRIGLSFVRTSIEHPALIGIARIISSANQFEGNVVP